MYGAAINDADFSGSGDQIRYRVDLGDSQGPFTVYAELLYQSIGYRWAQNLAEHPSEESAFFLDAYAAVSNVPLVVASTIHEVQ